MRSRVVGRCYLVALRIDEQVSGAVGWRKDPFRVKARAASVLSRCQPSRLQARRRKSSEAGPPRPNVRLAHTVSDLVDVLSLVAPPSRDLSPSRFPLS